MARFSTCAGDRLPLAANSLAQRRINHRVSAEDSRREGYAVRAALRRQCRNCRSRHSTAALLGPCHRRAHLGVSLLGSLHLAFDVRDPRFPANSDANKQPVRATLAKGRNGVQESARASAHYVKHSRDRSGIVLGDSELEVWQRLARYRLRGLSHDPKGRWPRQLTAAACAER